MQAYKYVARTLTPGASVFDAQGNMAAQNYSEFMTYLNEQYLSRGYTIHTVQLLRVLPPSSDGSQGYLVEYGYHLVGEAPKAK